MQASAEAHPQKRLFISLLTRDITLADAFMDLIDNSLNAAIQVAGAALTTAADYFALATTPKPPRLPKVEIALLGNKVTIRDTAGGIPFEAARDHVFVFGRSDDEQSVDDRLSVYGIGLKRAIFKLGKTISIRSNHPDGGFSMTIDVQLWESKKDDWTFEITDYKSDSQPYGTEIVITDLYDDISRRIADTTFYDELFEKISKTYNFYIGTLVDISVNGRPVTATDVLIGQNQTVETFDVGEVSVLVACGLGVAEENRYVAEKSGWFVYCNGRAVAFADKSSRTGWGSYLPNFQPKHRPFTGIVFFVAVNPENLPWTTTKTGINEESLLWQNTLRRMADSARSIITFLDRRYTDEGTSVSSSDLNVASGVSTSVRTAPVASHRVFIPPKPPAEDPETSIQYKVLKSQVDTIRKHLGRRSLSNVDIGKLTFDYYLKNEIDD